MLVTTTASGETWCLAMASGPQGEFSAVACDPAKTGNVPPSLNEAFFLKKETHAQQPHPHPHPHAHGQSKGQTISKNPTKVAYAIFNEHVGYSGDSHLQLGIRNSFGSSGPVPHSRWTASGGGSFWFDPDAEGGL
jgi:hypothetical protein